MSKKSSEVRRLQQQPGFGSATNRFASKPDGRPGPAAYTDPRCGALTDNKPSFRVKRRPFATTASRFAYYDREMLHHDIPGPGAYDVDEADNGKTLTSHARQTKIAQAAGIARRIGLAFGAISNRFRYKTVIYSVFSVTKGSMRQSQDLGRTAKTNRSLLQKLKASEQLDWVIARSGGGKGIRIISRLYFRAIHTAFGLLQKTVGLVTYPS